MGSGGSDPPGVDRMFYALEVFCENLEAELLPHLPALMERLFAVLAAPTSVHMKELAISAIGATGKFLIIFTCLPALLNRKNLNSKIIAMEQKNLVMVTTK